MGCFASRACNTFYAIDQGIDNVITPCAVDKLMRCQNILHILSQPTLFPNLIFPKVTSEPGEYVVKHGQGSVGSNVPLILKLGRKLVGCMVGLLLVGLHRLIGLMGGSLSTFLRGCKKAISHQYQTKNCLRYATRYPLLMQESMIYFSELILASLDTYGSDQKKS